MVHFPGRKHKQVAAVKQTEQDEYLRRATRKPSTAQVLARALGAHVDDERPAPLIETPDMRTNFFTQDDVSTPTRSTSDEGASSTAGYFGISKRGATSPDDGSLSPNSTRHTQRAVSSRHSRSTFQRDSRSLQRSRSSVSTNASPESEAAGPSALSPPPTRRPLMRPVSYHDVVEDFSRTNNFPGTTPLGSPLQTPSAEDPMLDSVDPFDTHYNAGGSREMLPHGSTGKTPIILTTDHGDIERHVKYADDGSDYDEKYESDYSSNMPSPMAIPAMNHSQSMRSLDSADRHSILKEQLAEMVYDEKRPRKARYYGSMAAGAATALPTHIKAPRSKRPWYRGWSTRNIILLIVGVIAAIALAIGLAVGLVERNNNNPKVGLTPTWRPAQGTTFNINLAAPISSVSTPKLFAYNVYDIDLFDNNATTIEMMHNMGRRVICYFSAGTYEDWRPDASQFPNNTLGSSLPQWVGERYVDIRDKTIQSIMAARIDLAVQKGCDGVDPDNVDSYSATSGFPLTAGNNAEYLNYLATYAHTADLAIGLKNAPELINATIDNLDWAVSESCTKYNECGEFQPFIQAGKPVFHVEYTDSGANATLLQESCAASGTHGFSTLIKRVALDAWSMSCPIGQTTKTFGIDSSM